MIFEGFLSRWLDIRKGEWRAVSVSFFGAFCVISFLILGRSLREAFYLTRFDVTTLPYITVAVVALAIPAVAAFGTFLAANAPETVFRVLLMVLGAGLLALWPLVAISHVATVAFYLWVALGSLLLTSGFWVVTSEHFTLRQAKRLFALVGGGGTLGLVVMGASTSWLAQQVGTSGLIPFLVGLLALLFASGLLIPPAPRGAAGREPGEEGLGSSVMRGLDLVWRQPHLRTIAMIVFFATAATAILDYQFKELVTGVLSGDRELTAFFGAFYGWTGVVAFFLQVLVAPRLLVGAGVAGTLAIMPVFLFMGSVGMLVAPALTLATIVRGGDNALRKSTYRSVLEYLYVPVPSVLRRKTKAFIDTTVDSFAEGCGAAVVFLWVTLGGMPTRFLSVAVAAGAIALLVATTRMGARYMDTLRERLRESGGSLDRDKVDSRFDGFDMLTMTMTQFDLQQQLSQSGIDLKLNGEGEGEDEEPKVLADKLSSSDPMVVYRALEELDDWDEEHVPELVRLLPRSGYYERVTEILRHLGQPATNYLIELLDAEETDFVIRRRIPKILTTDESVAADDALIRALHAGRFEVRYRSAIALVRRRKKALAQSRSDWKRTVWRAIDKEVSRDRPIWELQKLLDGAEAGADDFVERRVGVRGELSLEHTFRLMSLVLDPELVRTAYHGIIYDDEKLKGISLEYLEQILPPDVRRKLWPFIGDVSDYQRRQSIRPVREVAEDLLKTGATLFADADDRRALRDAIESRDRETES